MVVRTLGNSQPGMWGQYLKVVGRVVELSTSNL